MNLANVEPCVAQDITYLDVVDESANILTVVVGLDEVAGGIRCPGKVSDIVAVDAHIAL